MVQAKEEEALDRRRDHWAKPPLLNEEGKAGATQDQAVMRNNVPTGTQGPSGKYGSSEKYGRPSERHGGVCYKADRLEGLEICPHTGAGCTWRGTELSKHLASHVEAHLALVTQECRRQAEEINRLRGKLEEASVGREVVITIIVIIMNMIMTITTTDDQGVLVWRVAGVGARLREARSSQGLELVGMMMVMLKITMMMIVMILMVMMMTMMTIKTLTDLTLNCAGEPTVLHWEPWLQASGITS